MGVPVVEASDLVLVEVEPGDEDGPVLGCLDVEAWVAVCDHESFVVVDGRVVGESGSFVCEVWFEDDRPGDDWFMHGVKVWTLDEGDRICMMVGLDDGGSEIISQTPEDGLSLKESEPE